LKATVLEKKMIILHGIYEDGKIEIEEKDLPSGKASFEIKIEKADIMLLKNKPTRGFENLSAFGMWKNRSEMIDSADYVRSQRVKIQERSR